jgi:hypothetical protein
MVVGLDFQLSVQSVPIPTSGVNSNPVHGKVISVISWRSVLFVEETGIHGKTTDLSQVTDKLYHIIVNHIKHYKPN